MNQTFGHISEDRLLRNGTTRARGNNKLPRAAVVILNWNGKGFLEKFLPSVLAADFTNMRVIVADNGSTDDSIPFLQQNFPTVELIVNGSNMGFAKGYNAALKQVESDYYILLNSDVEVTKGWIGPVIALMESDPAIAACQPKLLDHPGKKLFEYAGACGGWIDRFGYPFARGRVFETCEADLGQYGNAAPCFWASGAAMFVRAAVFHQLGGFDEYFFAHQEEIDLCWRMQRNGYKIFIEPASVVYHVGGGTLPKSSPRKTYLNFRNNLVMLFKNLPWLLKFWIIPVRLFLDALAAWKELLSGNSSFFLAVLKAHLHFAGWIFFEKKHFFANKNINEVAGYYSGSIVWDYFIRKKKTFSEIVGNK